jgi:hypothetical protein
MRGRAAVTILCPCLWLVPSLAQARQENAMPMPMPEPQASPSAPPPPTLFESDMSRMTGMTARDPMAGMAMSGWSWMDMGIARLQFNHQGGPSGDDAVESSNWNMVMAQHDALGGRLTLMTMNSLEPATFAEGGTPELFQTGEAFHGRALVDRQHPHDFFMNLSATYRRPVGAGALWIQVAPVGEPALGPVAFMHRASSGENPTAPLTHHWLDSTHITSDLVTAGGGRGRIGLEASVFHGREPDEHRWNLDGGALDSVSARVKVALGGGWSAQASHAVIKNAEQLVAGTLRRTTASVHYGEAGDRRWAASFMWGRNHEEHGVSQAVAAEGAWQASARDHVFARAEWVEKDRVLLATKSLGPEPSAGGEETVPVRALTAGYLHNLASRGSARLGLGIDLTVYGVPAVLRDAYGSHPLSTHVFARLRWGRPHGAHAHPGHVH